MSYLRAVTESEFVRRAKSLGLWLMAKYLRNELPEVPGNFKFSGPFWRWLRPRVKRITRPNTWLFYSLLQSKRAAAPLSESMILDAYMKHSESMEIVDPIDDETEELVMKQLTPVLSQISRKLQKLYRSKHSQMISGETKYAPSERACFGSKRSDGGQKSAVIDSCIAFGGQYGLPALSARYDSPTLRCESERELHEMVLYPSCVKHGRIRHFHVESVYRLNECIREARETIRNLALLHDTPKRLNARIYGILEPLKVRVISKGEAVPYYVSKELQKALHTSLRGMDCFRLIGRPLCPTDLMDLAVPYPDEGEVQREWLSVDYSSATDWLSARLSRRILETLIADLDGPQDLWMNVLAPHKCYYPPVRIPGFKKPIWLPSVEQQNGQLMGSPLSFPILCLANLGLYLAVQADRKASLRDKLSRVLVNGDDMIYVGSETDWNRHIELGRKVGLIMTPGKAYRHPVFANANSTCFHMDLGDERATPSQITFLNTGLFFGQNKVLGQTDDEPTTTDPLADERGISTFRTPVLGTLLEGCRNVRIIRTVFKRYLMLHKDEIKKECGWRGLFVKTCWGGMGIDPPPGITFRVTHLQRKVAKKRLRALGSRATRTYGGPEPGARVPDVEPPSPFIFDSKEPDMIEVPGPRVSKRYSWRDMLPSRELSSTSLVACHSEVSDSRPEHWSEHRETWVKHLERSGTKMILQPRGSFNFESRGTFTYIRPDPL